MIDIPPGTRVALDTSALISHLSGTEPSSPAARVIFEDMIGTGRWEGVISTVSVAEALQRPIRSGAAAVGTLVGFLDSLDELQIRSADFLVGAEAARIRVVTGISLADAMVIATAVLTSSQVLVTNDRRMAAAARQAVPELRVVLLSEIAAV